MSLHAAALCDNLLSLLLHARGARWDRLDRPRRDSPLQPKFEPWHGQRTCILNFFEAFVEFIQPSCSHLMKGTFHLPEQVLPPAPVEASVPSCGPRISGEVGV